MDREIDGYGNAPDRNAEHYNPDGDFAFESRGEKYRQHSRRTKEHKHPGEGD